MSITCTTKTEHYATGKKLLQHYDTNKDGIIERQESIDAGKDYFDDIITKDELDFVIFCYDTGSIDAACEAVGPQTCIQHVKVLDDNNQPIPYASVQCGGPSVSTDRYGITGFSLDEGNAYTVVASKPGYDSASKSFTACSSTISLILSRTTCVQSIQVKDNNGAVLRQAKVVVNGTTKYTSIFGAPCSFDLFQGTQYDAVASKTDYDCVGCKKSFSACTGTITIVLQKPVPTTADITFDSSPRNAAVQVDGALIGNT